MADTLNREQRRYCMSQVRSRDTRPEMHVRQSLHAAGFRFRLHSSGLPGKPDIVLPKYRSVVFVHGCFWHGHDCPAGKLPTTNRTFWILKRLANQDRDRRCLEALQNLGWSCHVIWTCELERATASLLENLRTKRRNLENGLPACYAAGTRP